MQITGHKTRSIFDRYHIVSDGDLKEAATRMETFAALQAQEQAKVLLFRPDAGAQVEASSTIQAQNG